MQKFKKITGFLLVFYCCCIMIFAKNINFNSEKKYKKRYSHHLQNKFVQLNKDDLNFTIDTLKPGLFDMAMIQVEGGLFVMGNREGQDDERPMHEVVLKGFFISKFEVTQEQWRLVMGKNPSEFKACLKCPVENVSWNDIQAFIKKLNAKTGKSYRLPTEAEWEYAAKGGSNNNVYKYAGSNEINLVAWYYENAKNKTHPAGSREPNALGVYDMTGNVWEWCSDWYDKNYYQQSKKNNPQGPMNGDYRVLRGGSWNSEGSNCRLTDRSFFGQNSRMNDIGFRVVYSMEQ